MMGFEGGCPRRPTLAAARGSRTPPGRLAMAACLLLAGCAQTGDPTAAPDARPAAAKAAQAGSAAPGAAAPGALYAMFHRALKSPDGASEAMRLRGQGAQIFRCEQRSEGPRWAPRLPDAELRDDAGKLVARYGASQTIEHVDGSRLKGEVVDDVPSPVSESLRWLLLRTQSYGKGALTDVSYVARINTLGGLAPDHCEPAQINQLLRVTFSADFVFYR